MSENKLMIRVRDVKKQYRLGQIGGGTLRGDLQSWWARKRGKEDPNTLIGTDQRLIGTTFMALNGVSFTVNKGEAVGIIGSNGAGKSTLLKLLTHVTAPTEGDIDLYGRVASMLEVGTGFHPEMTGRENVYLNGAILGMTRAEIDAKMDEIIEFSEVRDFIDTPVKRYSSGMFVKLAFSVAAHLDSEIMIMDEVLAVGDMKFQKKCLTKMRQAAQRDGKTVLYVSHNMATIRDLCDRCIVLDKGKVVFDGGVDEGIALYLSTRSQASEFVDYSAFKRDNWFKRDNIRLQNVHLLVPTVEAIERSQPVRMRFVIKAQESAGAVGLRFEVRDEVGTPLATSCLYGLQLQPGDNTFTVSYDLSVLSPGKYSNYFTLFTAGEGGTHIVEDWVPGIQFRMVDTFSGNQLEWNAKDWGAIRLPEAVLCQEDA
ncbi:polysaccharide ABC transporter ATP-binding protein [uncultured Gemmiger sp.]|jgi:ABC-type polysaccharide/polyol phosphate transport system ATPase subunit|uniref:ABC transporter ATP-binding protein n=1 Tax=uncultured Gemmiger sp. TaxID=1623490 RepID=UPI0025DF5901|nr:polysaccharide ABC transporter ATP-binding protein [uncultured Gemmiger sp.]